MHIEDPESRNLIITGSGHGTKDRVVSAYGRTLLEIFLTSVGNLEEFRSRRQHTTTEPDGISLHLVGMDIHINRGRLKIKNDQPVIYIHKLTA